MTETQDNSEIEVDEDATEGESFVEYDIASYPSDLTLSVLHEMWNENEISIPKFQRSFVWTIKQSSLLIESFLLGLPIPQAFFHVDSENKNWIIDGQQRILSVVFFFEGYFGFENVQGRRQVFRLTGLGETSPYNNKRFVDLSESDQRKLKQSILRIINIRQLAPKNNDTSIYHIFERLNTGGTPLRPQEIRNCVFHGQIVETLNKLNQVSEWRRIIGRDRLDKHQRDVEMILRIFAFSVSGPGYEKPMKEFLNKRMSESRNDADGKLSKFAAKFSECAELIDATLPPKPFNVRGPINLAAMDSVFSILISHRGSLPNDLKNRFERLLQDDAYQEVIFFNTSDKDAVRKRLEIAETYLIR